MTHCENSRLYLFTLSLILNIEISVQMLSVEKIHCATKAKPSENFKS